MERSPAVCTEEFADTSRYPYGTYPFRTFNPIQSATLPFVDDKCNVIICAPTSSGKTIAGELIAGRSLSKGFKVLYLSPLRALAEEKISDWGEFSHPWFDYRKCITTGDHALTEKKVNELNKADIIIATYEMFAVRCRNSKSERSDWLRDVRTVIIDEAHFIASKDRGDHLESALMLFSTINPKARIVFMSATLTNPEEVVGWLTQLNGKITVLVRSDYRPCKLTTHFVTYTAPRGGNWVTKMQKVAALQREELLRLIEANPDSQWLVFVHAKATGRVLGEFLAKRFPGKVAFHNADRDKETRTKLEKLFKVGKCRILIATSTLAYGVNLPARRVAIMGVKRGVSEVDPLDIIQECGRAGRPKYDKEGDAYIILEDIIMPRWVRLIREGISAKSCLNFKLGFHLIGEIAEQRVGTVDEATAWLSRSLATMQALATPQVLPDIFKDYSEKGLIEFDSFTADSGYTATTMGKIASQNYFDPDDIVDWKNNLVVARGRALLRDDAAIAWMLARIHSNFQGYIPKEMKSAAGEYLGKLQHLNLSINSQGGLAKATALHAVLANDTDTQHRCMPLISGFRADLDRVISCMKQIAQRVLNFREVDYWEQLHLRFLYGVPWECAELCGLPGVGRAYAQRLYAAGVRSINAVYDNPRVVREILPEHVVAQIYENPAASGE